jgi:4'-phosphopantetheinyl transferase EntD
MNISELQWVLLGDTRVICWSESSQPSELELESAVSQEVRLVAAELNHGQRRRELLASRYLSRYLVGIEPTSGNYGEPLWSKGLVGSISHKQGHVALWVGSMSGGYAGVDLERCSELADGVIDKLADDDERRLIHDQALSASLLFSAKESIYKALWPLVRRTFWFDAVRVIDVCINGEDAIMMFQVRHDLCEQVRQGQMVRVHGRRMNLDQNLFWLTCVRFNGFQGPRSAS